MSTQQCPQCGAPRRPKAVACARCGLAFVASAPAEAFGAGQVLVLRLQSNASEMWQVSEPSTEIGRTSPSPIVLPDRSVSRRHARIVNVQGEYLLEDLDSRNGTFANGRPVTKAYLIRPGDELKFGDVVVLAEVSGAVARTPPPPGGLNPEATLLFAGELPPTPPPVPRGRAAARSSAPDDATVLESRKLARDSDTGPPRTPGAEAMPPTVIFDASPRAPQAARKLSPRPAERAELSGRLPELVAAADGLAGSLRRFQQDLAAALELIERSGGRETVQAVLDHLRRLESGQAGSRDAEALGNWLPTVRTLLEAQLNLTNLLAPLGSPTTGQRPRNELQPHPANLERVTGPY